MTRACATRPSVWQVSDGRRGVRGDHGNSRGGDERRGLRKDVRLSDRHLPSLHSLSPNGKIPRF